MPPLLQNQSHILGRRWVKTSIIVLMIKRHGRLRDDQEPTSPKLGPANEEATVTIPKEAIKVFLSIGKTCVTLVVHEKEAINGLIEKTIFEADDKGVKVLTLRLYNQANQPNGLGKLYLYKRPMLKVRIVDESRLATIVILNSIRQDIKQILFKGHITKVAYTVIQDLCCKGVKNWLPRWVVSARRADGIIHALEGWDAHE
ncbi:hypothetical protein HPP92_011362 [Vanilla planifolia]|uniref:Very-long-chain aldehyde decarbonylase CER1-like C-terminal domain-containing protein n=1 Tax=Vanilla planifolia TaxID=51239 RepID=A0A835UYD4_VANPL|nr:hypothetical protein HPP92_011362 [Vanilla planifolia]